MIVPETMYITLDYTLEISDEGWVYSDGAIMVNGRTAEQSHILIDLLISFIFPTAELSRLPAMERMLLMTAQKMKKRLQFSTRALRSVMQSSPSVKLPD